MVVNDTYRVKIESLDHKGRGVVHIGNIPVFIEETLPLEEVDIKITKVTKKYAEGCLLKILKESKVRNKPSCPYYHECGGCDLMHMSYQRQLLFKEEKVKEIMKKFAKLDSFYIKPILFCDNLTFYRNKATFKVNKKIGFFQKKSNHIIEIDKCQIVNPVINDILNLVKERIDLTYVTEFVIRISETSHESMLILKISENIDEQMIIKNLESEITTILTYKDNHYNILTGNGYIREKIGKKTYIISADSFFQVNTEGAKMIYDKVLEFLDVKEEDTILDLYCGTGTIGIYVSDDAKEVCGIEVNRYAILDALKNKKLNKVKNIDFICKSASDIGIKDKATKVIVDPPRAGLDKKTISFFLKTKPLKIVYVSCDPVTLARDISMLKTEYEIKEIVPIDMFPFTEHVECVCVLNRR